jgi:hypothetical protein
LRPREPGFVHPCVDLRLHPRSQFVDLGTQRGWVEVNLCYVLRKK